MGTFVSCLTSRDTRWDGESPDDFRKKMTGKLAALVLLTTFVTLAAVDVYNIARIEGCAQHSECGLSGYH